ncbi:MAG TPA: DUF4412 domain-containing protein [Gammaproteobacteria bacterium]|nr:DUF4412 domain-containing protein [Gammaproteobacteria bacterium]
MLRTSFLLAATALALPALADTHIAYVSDNGQPSSQIYVKGGKVRMESGSQERSVAIYDAASNTITVLMPEKKQYMVFDQKAAAQMGAQMNAAQQQTQGANAQMQAAMQAHQSQMDEANRQMQAAMAKMSPEQRAQMEQMMAAHGGANPGAMAGTQGGGDAGFQAKDLGTTETIAGHSCKDVQMMMGSRPISTACVMSSMAGLGIPSSDLKTLEDMREGMRKLVSQMGPMAQGMSGMMNQGFALKTTRQSYQGYNRVTVTDTFKSVSTSGLPASLFEVPTGYSQTNMQEMMQRSHP